VADDPDLLYKAGLMSYAKGELRGAQALFQQAAVLGHPKASLALTRVGAEMAGYSPQSNTQSQYVKSPAQTNYLVQAMQRK
jgi:hypothetical protein